MADATLPQFVTEDVESSTARPSAAKRRRTGIGVDLYLLITVSALLAIGLIMVFSTTFFLNASQFYFFFQQARSLALGGVLMLALTVIDYRVWRRLAIPMMAVIVVLLIVVLLGKAILGSHRALINGGYQPSEPAKLVVVIYMAAWLASKRTRLGNLLNGLLPFAVLVGIVGGLIIAEPDLSTAALVLTTSAIMFFLAGADWVQLAVTGGVFVVVGGFAVTHIDYAQLRLQSWLDVIRDPVQAHASHAQNVIISFLNGGLTGVGLGSGYQKFYNLSVPQSDSIFAVIGEELGLLGCAVVMILFIVFMWRGFRIARRAPDAFGSLLACGITVLIVVQALYNIAAMATIVPLAGVPLPFISFGGSSLVTVMAAAGLLLSISRATARQEATVKSRRTVARILDFGGWDRRRRLSRPGNR